MQSGHIEYHILFYFHCCLPHDSFDFCFSYFYISLYFSCKINRIVVLMAWIKAAVLNKMRIVWLQRKCKRQNYICANKLTRAFQINSAKCCIEFCQLIFVVLSRTCIICLFFSFIFLLIKCNCNAEWFILFWDWGTKWNSILEIKALYQCSEQNIITKIYWYLLEMANTKKKKIIMWKRICWFAISIEMKKKNIAYSVVSRLLGIVIRLSETELYTFIMWFVTADKRKTKPLNRLLFNYFFFVIFWLLFFFSLF